MVLALRETGLLQERLADYPDAIQYYSEALHLADSINWEEKIPSLNNDLGIAHKNRSEYKKALDYYFAALEKYENMGHKFGTAQVQGNIGMMRATGVKLRSTSENIPALDLLMEFVRTVSKNCIRTMGRKFKPFLLNRII